MEDAIALLDQIAEEHQATFQRLKDLGQVVNDVEAIAGLEKSKESFVPGRLDQKAGLQKMQDMLETIASGLEGHFNREETRLLDAFERHGDKRLASTLNSLLQEHWEIRQRFANSQSQMAKLVKGGMSQNLWAANANDMRAYLNYSLKLVEKHAGAEQTLLAKLRRQLAGELKNGQEGEKTLAKEINLSVNNTAIEIDGFVKDYIEHVIGAVLATLRGTGPIENLELTIDKDKQVTINLNNVQVPLCPFPNEIIGNTIKGMVSTLKGVSEIVTISITINE